MHNLQTRDWLLHLHKEALVEARAVKKSRPWKARGEKLYAML
jgi:hypothetical protein